MPIKIIYFYNYLFHHEPNNSMNPIVLTIIAANVLLSFKGFNDLYFFERYKFQVGPINSGQRIRLLSSAFLHVDVTHLLFNMLTL